MVEAISKNRGVATVELTEKTRKNQVSIETLRPLAPKMSARF